MSFLLFLFVNIIIAGIVVEFPHVILDHFGGGFVIGGDIYIHATKFGFFLLIHSFDVFWVFIEERPSPPDGSLLYGEIVELGDIVEYLLAPTFILA